MSTIQGQPVTNVPSTRAGTLQNILTERLGELPVTQWLPKYAALNWSSQVFYASHSAAQALSVNSTTFTGLAVSNPLGSGHNLVVLDVILGIAAATSAISTPRLGYAAPVALTQGNAIGTKGVSALVGAASASVASIGASGTLTAAPTTLRPLSGSPWVTGGTGWVPIYSKDEVAGAIIIAPNQMLTIDALVGAMSVIATVTWAELPV